MRLYFAYGSNLNSAQMRERCPQSRKFGVARLPGYRWIITTRGYASVVASPDDVVEGVIYELSDEDEQLLDGFEGVADGRYRKVELPVVKGQESVPALVYIDPITAEGEPKAEYIGRMNAGVADAGLSELYVAGQIRRYVPDT